MEASAVPRLAPAGAFTSPHLLRLASDARLVALIREGRSAAFEVLYDRHHRGILSFCRHMLGDPQEAEDAVQHTFLSAYNDLMSSHKQIHLRAWLFAIARNRCYSILRSRRDQPAADDVSEPATEGLATQVQRRQDLRDLVVDMRRLPDEQRAALVLAELDALSHEQIGEALGVPREKVKALVFQARESLLASRNARETDCAEIRQQLATLRGGALRRSNLRRHLRECAGCRDFRKQIERQRRQFAVLMPVAPTLALKEGVLAGTIGASATVGVAGGGFLASTALKSALTKVIMGAVVAGAGTAGTIVATHLQGGTGSVVLTAPSNGSGLLQSISSGEATTPATEAFGGAQAASTEAAPAPHGPAVGSGPMTGGAGLLAGSGTYGTSTYAGSSQSQGPVSGGATPSPGQVAPPSQSAPVFASGAPSGQDTQGTPSVGSTSGSGTTGSLHHTGHDGTTSGRGGVDGSGAGGGETRGQGGGVNSGYSTGGASAGAPADGTDSGGSGPGDASGGSGTSGAGGSSGGDPTGGSGGGSGSGGSGSGSSGGSGSGSGGPGGSGGSGSGSGGSGGSSGDPTGGGSSGGSGSGGTGSGGSGSSSGVTGTGSGSASGSGSGSASGSGSGSGSGSSTPTPNVVGAGGNSTAPGTVSTNVATGSTAGAAAPVGTTTVP